MDYPDSVEYLYALGNEHKAFKLGLDPVSRLLAALGNPHHQFRSIHIAGTNGKGSTSAMIEAGLRAGGVHTGLFTSPHLVDPTERIRISGENISREDFARQFNRVHETAESLVREGALAAHPSYFETVTAMAFCAFSDHHVDTAVVEVGLGGRLDATNVITPVLCVITSIDYDHEAWLGSSLEAIAGEKAGILKEGVPAVFAIQRAEVLPVLDARAKMMRCPTDYAAAHNVRIVHPTERGIDFELDGAAYHCPLPGNHQVQNAVCAVLALRTLGIEDSTIASGLRNTRWPARLEYVASDPDILLDGAHNPAGARSLAAYIEEYLRTRTLVLIYGAMRDKSVDEITELLFPLANSVIVTAPASQRALRPEALVNNSAHQQITAEPDIAHAIAFARRICPVDGVILITGSLYLAGEARALLVE